MHELIVGPRLHKLLRMSITDAMSGKRAGGYSDQTAYGSQGHPVPSGPVHA